MAAGADAPEESLEAAAALSPNREPQVQNQSPGRPSRCGCGTHRPLGRTRGTGSPGLRLLRRPLLAVSDFRHVRQCFLTGSCVSVSVRICPKKDLFLGGVVSLCRHPRRGLCLPDGGEIDLKRVCLGTAAAGDPGAAAARGPRCAFLPIIPPEPHPAWGWGTQGPARRSREEQALSDKGPKSPTGGPRGRGREPRAVVQAGGGLPPGRGDVV